MPPERRPRLERTHPERTLSTQTLGKTIKQSEIYAISDRERAQKACLLRDYAVAS